jgi:site-specific DNA-methyltransferase (adenine-specific)
LRLAHPSEILVRENRHRQYHNPNAAEELYQSIKTHGLIHAPVCRIEDLKIILVAGERRFKAMTKLIEDGFDIRYHGEIIPPDNLPYELIQDLDPTQAEEIEFEENARRMDLTWQEKAQAIARLHSFRTSKDPAHTPQDTVRELTGGSPGNVTELVNNRVLLAEHLYKPEVANAKTEKDALKILRSELLDFFTVKAGELSRINILSHTVLEMDSLVGIRTLEAGQFDCIVTDPPYGIDAETWNSNEQHQNQHSYSDDQKTVQKLLTEIIPEFFRVAKPQAHVYMFCDINQFPLWKSTFTIAGFEVWYRPLIWAKGNQGMLPQINYGPRNTYEAILFANKGRRPVTGIFSDVLDVSPVQRKDHAAQKPVDLYSDLLGRTCNPGDRILDPFCGSGTIFHSAKELNLIALGIDSDPVSVGMSRQAAEEEETNDSE